MPSPPTRDQAPGTRLKDIADTPTAPAAIGTPPRLHYSSVWAPIGHRGTAHFSRGARI